MIPSTSTCRYTPCEAICSSTKPASARARLFLGATTAPPLLGRLDGLKASGRLEALIRSGLRHCEKFALIDAHAAGET